MPTSIDVLGGSGDKDGDKPHPYEDRPKVIFYTRSGKKVLRQAESVILVTSTVSTENVGMVSVLIDNDVMSEGDYVAMVAELLVVMEQRGGEDFAGLAIARYLELTGKIDNMPHNNATLGLFYMLKGRKEGLKIWKEPEPSFDDEGK